MLSLRHDALLYPVLPALSAVVWEPSEGYTPNDEASEASEVPPDASSDFIVATPGTCSGLPRIAGHRVRVMDIAVLHDRGHSVAEIVDAFPTLTAAQVAAALAYYAAHHAEIQADLAHDEELHERLKRENPSLLQQKLRQRRDL